VVAQTLDRLGVELPGEGAGLGIDGNALVQGRKNFISKSIIIRIVRGYLVLEVTEDAELPRLGQLVRTYFRLGGHHLQFNVVDAATLRAARKHPEKYRDLIVRVAGYSDYFVDLGPDLQEEIIKRTEHSEF
jgi:hypothetical protein